MLVLVRVDIIVLGKAGHRARLGRGRRHGVSFVAENKLDDTLTTI